MAEATIIMAGGSGTRLWPASLPRYPKQLLRIGAADAAGRRHSLVQQAILRGLAATPDGPVVIVTHRDHVAPIAEHVTELQSRPEHANLEDRVVFLPEPVARNTAPAIALGVRYLRTFLADDATALVLTADHVISPVSEFVANAAYVNELARAGHLVTFGIPPLRPETGYGYVQAGEPIGELGMVVDGFTEKPDAQTAERYLRSGNFFWNSGMFAFSLGRFWNELASHEPSITDAFAPLEPQALKNPDQLQPVYAALTGISIDYALMERSKQVAVVPASFSWNDVGSWDEAARLAQLLPGTGTSDASAADASAGASAVLVESGNVFVDSDLPVAVCGVDDVHVVVKNGKVLVCRRGRSQLVKLAVEKARSLGLTGYEERPEA